MSRPYRRIDTLFTQCAAILAVKDIYGFATDGVLQTISETLEKRLEKDCARLMAITVTALWHAYDIDITIKGAISSKYLPGYNYARANGYQGSFEDYLELQYETYVKTCESCLVSPMDWHSWESHSAQSHLGIPLIENKSPWRNPRAF